jgi:hypothetical protein
MKQNVYSASDQKLSMHNVGYEERNGIENEIYLPSCFYSFESLKSNHEQTEKVDKCIVAQSHLPSPKIGEDIQQDFQQDKVFQSSLPSPMNDVVVQIISGLDMDDDSETTSMEISSNEKTSDIEF